MFLLLLEICVFSYASAIVFLLQVFYYLGELNDSLSYALGAGPLFDVSEDSDYVHTLLGKYNLNFAIFFETIVSVSCFKYGPYGGYLFP